MRDTMRLGVLATHPVQYFSPLYRELAASPSVDLTVFYAHRPTPVDQGSGFGVPFEWDIDLLSGYRHRFLVNRSASPSSSDADFGGCDTPEIADVIAREAFDAFLIMGWHARTYWQAMSGAWAASVPLLVRGDSQLIGESLPKRLVKRALYPLFVRRFVACLSVGTRSDEYFRHYGARRIVRSPHFVDNDFFGDRARALAGQRQELRPRLGIPGDALVALFVGKLIEKKRPLDLVRAVAAAGRRDLWLLVVGDGELRSACEAEAARLAVNARFVGFRNQSELPESYAVSDVLVLPSDGRETWGLVVNEAMASGVCAIVSDAAGCAPDLIIDGQTGYRFPLGDVQALASLLQRVCDDRQLLRVMQHGAGQHINGFDVRAAAAGVLMGIDESRRAVAA